MAPTLTQRHGRLIGIVSQRVGEPKSRVKNPAGAANRTIGRFPQSGCHRVNSRRCSISLRRQGCLHRKSGRNSRLRGWAHQRHRRLIMKRRPKSRVGNDSVAPRRLLGLGRWVDRPGPGAAIRGARARLTCSRNELKSRAWNVGDGPTHRCRFILPCMPDSRLVTCPQCGTKFGTAKSLDVHRCPECFARFSKSDSKIGGWVPIAASVLIVLAFVLLVVWTWP